MQQAIAVKASESESQGEDQYGVIIDYLRDSMDCTNMQMIASKVEKAVRRVLDVAVMAIFLNDNGTATMILPKEYRLPDFFLYQPKRKWGTEETVKTGKVVHYPLSWYKDERTTRELQEVGGRSTLSLPIIYNNNVIAALTVVLKGEGKPSTEIMQFCTTICGFLSVQLRSAIEHHDLHKELNEWAQTESDLDFIFSDSADMIAIFSRDGYLKRMNPAFEKRLGYSRKEMSSKPITAFAHPADRDYVQYVLDHIAQEGSMQGLCHRFLNKEKKVIFLELNVRYMGESDLFIAIAKDMTNQREVEAKNMALEQSIALERMKTEFFSNISHEFKTPINIILSSVDLLKLKLKRDNEKLYDEQYKRFFTYTQQNSYKLLRLINNLLDCTKIDSGALNLLAKNCFIVPFVRQVVETTESYATAHGIDIRFVTDVDEDFLLYCDQDKVDRILLNLISNSIKHTEKDGHIVVSMTKTPTYLKLSVADDGEGIPEKMLPHIFEKFRVYEEGFVKSCDGTGVGLSIVKGLTELHGGTISVSSKRGEGTEFTVTLSHELPKSMSAKRVKMVSQQQDNELHQSRLQMEMSNIE